MKPLFIPLKREYFEAFKAGTKVEEFRPWGARWNAHTCPVGRPVTLSLGYGKAHRLSGTITGFEVRHEPTTTPAWIDCYGPACEHLHAACIRIRIEDQR